MARADPINRIQFDLLEWVSGGCPDGVMTGHTYKTTAKALEWRGLLTVSKKDGAWQASLTDTGRYYLQHGSYPDGHRDRKRPVPRTPRPTTGKLDDSRTRPTPLAQDIDSEQRPAPPTPPPVKTKPPRASRPVDQLTADLIDAGGVLEVKKTYDGSSPDYDRLLASAIRYDQRG